MKVLKFNVRQKKTNSIEALSPQLLLQKIFFFFFRFSVEKKLFLFTIKRLINPLILEEKKIASGFWILKTVKKKKNKNKFNSAEISFIYFGNESISRRDVNLCVVAIINYSVVVNHG